ncbi:hypothetical protein RHMOL_Rhmol10G0142500 [Rhododendron molle]|uniref:Uncharacterized protein n=2 Tax=Rhododendron molle TaxID=49168 RepID=A0ACC0M2F7_RHOML|nr:hypothetical protein RHMOL_Rhmol10G0142500 [Rhododendron molle]
MQSLCFYFLILLLSSIFSPSQAGCPITGMTARLSLGAIKNSGPSPGGGNHHLINSQTLGGVKDSGPSPGTGNNVVTGTHP